MPTTVLASDLAHAVYAGDLVQNEAFLIRGDIEGTAFYLGDSFFMTACHVVKTLKASGSLGGIGITAPGGSPQRVAVVRDTEELCCDIGVVRVEFLAEESNDWARPLRWTEAPLQALEPVVTFGYPYGIHRLEEETNIIARAFSGYVVAALPRFKPLGSALQPFAVYELSFGAPRGLSGAPVFSKAMPDLRVAAVVIGNSKSQMLILDSEEVEEASGERVRRQSYESLSLGVATQSASILGKTSQLLGMTVRDWLEHYGLLAGA